MAMRNWKGEIVSKAEEYQALLHENLLALDGFMRKEAEARNTHRERLAALREKERSGDYSKEYLEREQAKIDAERAAVNDAAHTKARELLEKLVTTMQARYDEPLDLTDPALSNALNIINLTGGKMDWGELVKLVDTFTGNPAALKTLKRFKILRLVCGRANKSAHPVFPE